ncbi:protein phosphatase 2C domain-containing protein [Stieleria varia]|uniref:Serine/threonine phosphatase stp n=1 Tax=Stieleria varia TaxID=2528005 RepID=A0A5C6AXL1_9BACT|nr:protein phosphatase 2C domain-containing protein [Stieleria varia]TWU04745.1 Serine/threonine phosphatase stp [Stieleria varia]
MKTIASAISDRGLKREGNEDQYLIDESLGLYLVCDGMGGHAAGEIAAERAIAFAAEYISDNSDAIESASQSPEGFYRVLKIAEEAVQNASQELHLLSKSNIEFAGMGTTMTLLLIVENKAVMAHVGDSRLYLMRDGDIHQLSVDHTLANEMYLSGGMTREEAQASRYQHVLTRSIGAHEFVPVDTLLFDLIPGDRFLLCSDGLSNYFSDTAVVASLLSEPEIISHPGLLVDFANHSGGSDNITAVLVDTQPDTSDPPESNTNTKAKLQCLGNTFLGSRLSVRRLIHLLSIATTIHCNAGKEILSRGEKSRGLIVVLKGRFRVDDDDIIESELTEGDSFGASSLVMPVESETILTALEPSQVLLIDRRKFHSLTRRLPRLGNALLRNLARHLSEQLAMRGRGRSFNMDDTGPLP